MINLNSVTKVKKGKTFYVLPGCIITDRAYYAMDVLMDIRDFTARTVAAQEARKSVMMTRSGAIVTRNQKGNKRYFLGV